VKLEKLSEKYIEGISGKKIYCYEKSDSHLKEFEEKYGMLSNIVGIIDDSKRSQGNICVAGSCIKVFGTEDIRDVSLLGAVIIITSDYYREAYEKLCMISSIMNQLDIIYYFPNTDTDYYDTYKEQYANQELENMIVFRSGPHALAYVHGMDYADNARALFEYMLAEGYNKKYELVWLVKNPQEFRHIEEVYENVYFLPYDGAVTDDKSVRNAYYRALCLSKYIFFTDAYGFCRYAREDQVRVQLWHGCGFKTRVNFSRCEKRYEVTTVISDLYAKIHADIYGLRQDQVLVTGYAKEDWLFHPVADWRERLHIPRAEKYIFWLPTFRKAVGGLANLDEKAPENQTGLPVISTCEEMESLNRVLKAGNAMLIVKLHPFQDRNMIAKEQFSNIFILDNDTIYDAGLQINQILGDADALISDYSSAAVDYLLLDRPVGFTLDDVEEYKQSRGFVFEPIKDWLPGEELYDFKDFEKYIESVIAGEDSAGEKRRRITKEMHAFGDDQSCARILEALCIVKE